MLCIDAINERKDRHERDAKRTQDLMLLIAALGKRKED